jgi:hypothetical protein
VQIIQFQVAHKKMTEEKENSKLGITQEENEILGALYQRLEAHENGWLTKTNRAYKAGWLQHAKWIGLWQEIKKLQMQCAFVGRVLNTPGPEEISAELSKFEIAYEAALLTQDRLPTEKEPDVHLESLTLA